MQARLFLLLFGAILFCSSKVTAQPFVTDDPFAYFDYIAEEQGKVADLFMGFSNLLLSDVDKQTAEAERVRILREVELGLRRVRNMAPIEGNSDFRDEAVSVFMAYRDLLQDDFSKISVAVSTQASTIAELEKYFGLQVKAEEKMEALADRFKVAEEAFATAHGINLVDNEMKAQFDRILAANRYSRTIFWSYLKVAKENEAWWSAYQADDLNGMESARADLEVAISKSEIKKMGPLFGNTDLREAAQARVDFLAQLVKEDFPKMESVIGNPKRTRADIDDLNARVAHYNETQTALNERFNQANLELKQRSIEGGTD